MTGVGAAGTVPRDHLVAHGVEEVDPHWSSRRPARGGSQRQRPPAGPRRRFRWCWVNVDLDGDGWLGIDEQACGTDAHDASSTPSDADGDGLCDDVDQVDDEVIHVARVPSPWATRRCAITGNMHVSSSIVHDPAGVLGQERRKQGGNTTTTGANFVVRACGFAPRHRRGGPRCGERRVHRRPKVRCSVGAPSHANSDVTPATPALCRSGGPADGVRALGVATGATTCIHDQRGDAWCRGSNLKGQLGSHCKPGRCGLARSSAVPMANHVGQQYTNQFVNFVDGQSVVQLHRFGCCNHQNTAAPAPGVECAHGRDAGAEPQCGGRRFRTRFHR